LMNTYPDVNPGATGNRTGTGSSSPRRSYVARHWRGDLSFGVSYWLNSFLANLAGFVVLLGVGLLTAPDKHPLIFALTSSAAWLFAIAISVWYLVGVWRSARHHKARGGRGFWAATACVAVVVGFCCLISAIATEISTQVEYWRIAVGDRAMGKHELRILRGGRELEFAGGITFGVTEEVRRPLDADPEIRMIHLNSLGGRIGEARKLRDLIRQRRLITYTASDCASACTIAFTGGVQRFVAVDAALGFHRGRFPGFTEAELAETNDEDRRGLIEAGVARWFANHAYSTPNSSMWWPTPNELKWAGVITGVAGPRDFALDSSTMFGLLENSGAR
jgi:hypothetical protein